MPTITEHKFPCPARARSPPTRPTKKEKPHFIRDPCGVQVTDPARERLGLPKVGWHDLRHTSATLLHQSEPLRVAQAILGHSDMETTLGYTHVLPGWQREAMNRLEVRLLFPNVPKSQAEPERQDSEPVGASTK
jgi:Phage integrase family